MESGSDQERCKILVIALTLRFQNPLKQIMWAQKLQNLENIFKLPFLVQILAFGG